ncbi:hypothetical protein LCGC14_1562640, partial [marine sediment metagenome]
ILDFFDSIISEEIFKFFGKSAEHKDLNEKKN